MRRCPSAGAARAHAGAVIGAMGPWSTGRQLPNFAPATDPARLARCYDEDTLYQLAALAERYDPAGVLRVGQVARYPMCPGYPGELANVRVGTRTRRGMRTSVHVRAGG